MSEASRQNRLLIISEHLPSYLAYSLAALADDIVEALAMQQ